MAILHKSLSSFSNSEVPQSHLFIPRRRKQIVIVICESQITDEVGVTGKGFDWLPKISQETRFRIEFPDEDSLISGAGDKDLSIFIFLLRVTSFNGGNPIRMALKMSNFIDGDLNLYFCHIPLINQYIFYQYFGLNQNINSLKNLFASFTIMFSSVSVSYFFDGSLNLKKYLCNIKVTPLNLPALNSNISIFKVKEMEFKQQYPPILKRIQQIKIKFSRDYPPYAHFNPYQFLTELNQEVKKNYDIQFIHIRYRMIKNKWQRQLNEIYIDPDFKIQKDINNVFSVEEGKESNFLQEYIFKDATKLVPPPDYDPTTDEKKLEKERELEEDKALREIQEAIDQIMKLYNEKHSLQRGSIRGLANFKGTSNRQQFIKSEYEIYAKGIMNQPVVDKLNEEKNAKNPICIKAKNNIVIKVYLHPMDKTEPISRLKKYHRISDWGLSTVAQTSTSSYYCEYFGSRDLEDKATKINSSVKLISSISFNEVEETGKIESFSILTYLWNEIILKMTVKLAQIQKIQKAVEIINVDTTEQKKITEYYLHLTYPAMFYISKMKKQEANTDEYIKNWERVDNFILLSNEHIQDNYLLRYFLFNNTMVKVNCTKEKSMNYSIVNAIDKIDAMIDKYKRTIEFIARPTLYKPKDPRYTLRNLAKHFQFEKFLKIFRNHPQLTIEHYDKIWKIKYLLLVMARFNHILPYEIDEIINHLEEPENFQHLDCHLYILWKTAINMWGYSNQEKRFYKYLLEEFESLKKMDISNILKKMMSDTDIIIYIFRVSLTPSGYLINPPTPQMKGRLMKQFSKESQFFLRVSLNEQNEIELKNQKYITKMMFRKQMSKIKLLGREYIPLGWSPSQLRSFSLWYFHEIEDRKTVKRLKRDYILNFLGNFDAIENPAKKAARIGQSFSASWTYDASKIVCEDIPDVDSQGYLFTDGIGKISAHLLQMISLRLSIRELSVIQMRYKGAKGVLALDPNLPKNNIQLRPSMIKFACDHKDSDKYLDILDWNKYKAGYLNRQIIILLRTLGIENTIFMDLQKQHIKTLSSMTFKDCSIFKHLNDDLNTEINNLEPANKTILDLLKAGFVLQKEPFFRGVLETLKKNGYHQLKVKSNIMVKESARIIGIIDEYGILDENEIYCSIHDMYALEPIRKVVEGSAIITRNPCLHPADIRIVTCVNSSEVKKRFEKIQINENRFEKFVNCVIFPMKGKFPLTAQISGSDLDGDNFFVCWDPRLIPEKPQPINLIDEAVQKSSKVNQDKVKKTTEQVYDQMLDFFINYTNYEKLGQIDNSHLVHADSDPENYANNKICMKLSQIHGKAVDFPKTGYCPPVSPELFVSRYPDFMEKQSSDSYVSTSILGKLYHDIKEKIRDLLDETANSSKHGIPQIDVDLLINYNFEQSQKQVDECLHIIKDYQKDLGNLINLVGVDSEHEVYSGNFSIVKNQVKILGKNRLISSILNLRERYFSLFFENIEDDMQKYTQCHSQEYLQKTKYFSSETYQKAQLMYLVSYFYKFQNLVLPENIQQFKEKMFDNVTRKNLETLKEQIDQGITNKISAKEGKYYGFIWFIIPKVIINLKVTAKAIQLKEKEIGMQNSENQASGNSIEFDDGEI